MNCFHFHIFDISETAQTYKLVFEFRCELLSFSYLWHIRNSSFLALEVAILVVNCFHFHIFDISETAKRINSFSNFLLWIAFIFISLTYQKQQLKEYGTITKVVNCFHFHIFDISETANFVVDCYAVLLWIAFIFISLTYQKQPLRSPTYIRHCCELLSFSYLWHIRNSY